MLGHRSSRTFIIIFILLFGVVLVLFKRSYVNKATLPDYSNGFVVLNTNRSVYSMGEEVQVQISVLSVEGKAVCSAEMSLEILDKEGTIYKSFSSSSGTIQTLDSCQDGKNSNSSPDYIVRYSADAGGEYIVRLYIGERVFEKRISIEQTSGKNIERVGATRIDPQTSERFPMILKVTSEEDFEGQIVDLVPEGITVVWQGESKVDSGKITWDATIKAGETKEFIYEYGAPQNPAVYSFGSAYMLRDDTKVFEESNQWQVTSSIK